MKRKIFRSMCLVALLSMLLGTLTATVLLCRDMQRQMISAVMTEVRYLESAMEIGGSDYLKHLASRGDGNSINRITWIDTDGSVLYDSYADPEHMENHADRPEVRKAFRMGRGNGIRSSETLSEQTYYCAVRLSDGTVIRVASTMRSGLFFFFHTIPWMVAMAVIIAVGTMSVSRMQTQKIVMPINRLDPEEPDEEQIYDELAPLVRKLEKQKRTIQQQMNTLREKQEEFEAITENMDEGFIIVDNKADVISYNSSAMRILGGEPVQKNGDGSFHILSLNRSSSFRQAVNTALEGRRKDENLELNGRYYQIIANPVVESTERHGAVVVILDVTEKQNREELRREFTANVSHELKTPLTSISGYAEIMKNGMVQPEDMARFSEKIYVEAQRLITLVGDIIKLSRLDEKSVEIEKSAVDLYQVATNVVSRMKDVAKKAKVTLSLKGCPAVVHGAEQILDEMIFNLCDNAIKYNHPYGDVYVTVEMSEGHPVLKVADTGIGIPKEDQERIFERFYRVDKSRSRQIGGTGLGLSIVKHGAIYHKARVEMESTLGEGTTVKIVF